MMKRLFYLLLLVVMQWNSTVMADTTKSELALADPFIYYEDGMYYAYGTHSSEGIEVYTSSDLTTWEKKGLALHKSNTTEQVYFWAPEVYKFGSEYYMYFSANEHLWVAKANSPMGPFKQIGTTSMMGDEKSIDSSVFTDDDGQSYLFFVRFTDGNCIWMGKLGSDHVTLDKSSLRLCASVSQTWETDKGRVNEGPCIVKKDGTYYMMYSGNDFNSQNYGVGVATTTNINGTWTKYADNPILCKPEDLMGTAHNGFFYDKDGKLRIVFHAHYSSTEVNPRHTYIGTLEFNNGKLQMSSDAIVRPKVAMIPDVSLTIRGMQYGTSVVADLNNDGNKDLIIGGFGRNESTKISDNSTPHTDDRQTNTLIYNATSGSWSVKANKLSVSDRPSIVPCDMNLDGKLDVVAFESVGMDPTAATYVDLYGREGVFLGTGLGTFDVAAMSFVGETGNAYDFDIRIPLTGDVADFNNDGLPDIVCAGYQINGDICNDVLINLGNNKFKVVPFDTTMELECPTVQAYDFNNDGYTDFVISAQVNDNASKTRLTEVYQNNPDNPGTFRCLGLSNNGIKPKYNGALQVADINNDGYLDIFLSGTGSALDGESAFKQRVYLNKGTADASFVSDASYVKSDMEWRALNSTPSSAGLIDWNGDGNFDLLIGGWVPTYNTQSGALFLNDGTGKLVYECSTPGGSENTVCFPDWNADGVKDLYTSGWCWDTSFQASDVCGRLASVVYNTLTGVTRPAAPVAGTVSGKAGAVTLTWTPAASALKNTTYEYFVKNADGNLVTQCTSFIGGDKDGIRKINHLGNAGCNKSIRLSLPAGTYTWGVQAVNAAYDGSTFSTGGFVVSADNVVAGISSVKNGNAKEVSRYGVNGKKLSAPEKGVNIVKYSDGAISKVVVK